MSNSQHKSRDVLRFFKDLGFRIASIKGSHVKMINKTNKHIIIPIHGKGVNRMILRRVLKEIGSEKFTEF